MIVCRNINTKVIRNIRLAKSLSISMPTELFRGTVYLRWVRILLTELLRPNKQRWLYKLEMMNVERRIRYTDDSMTNHYHIMSA